MFNRESAASHLKQPAAEEARARILFDGVVLFPSPDEEGDITELGRIALALTDLDAPGPDRATRAAILLSLMTGARAGEIAALQWPAVRLDDQIPTLTITRGKTQAASRTLPLPDRTVALLRAIKAEAGKSPYIFPARSAGGRAEHLHAESLSRRVLPAV
ncbi:MAG TPA: tyrosine-type recombinase/integrase [Methylocystis sp.]